MNTSERAPPAGHCAEGIGARRGRVAGLGACSQYAPEMGLEPGPKADSRVRAQRESSRDSQAVSALVRGSARCVEGWPCAVLTGRLIFRGDVCLWLTILSSNSNGGVSLVPRHAINSPDRQDVLPGGQLRADTTRLEATAEPTGRGLGPTGAPRPPGSGCQCTRSAGRPTAGLPQRLPQPPTRLSSVGSRGRQNPEKRVLPKRPAHHKRLSPGNRQMGEGPRAGPGKGRGGSMPSDP